MNAHIRNLTLLAVAAALPLSVAAQASNSSPSTSPSSSSNPSPSTTRDSTGSTTRSTDTSHPATSSGYSTAGTADLPGSAMTAAGTASIRRVSENAIERQFTAKALIGKDVYDNSNKKVGEVRDVVLDSSRSPQLASALSMRSGSRSSGMRATSDASVNAAGAAGASTQTGSASTSEPTVSGAIASSAERMASSAADLAAFGAGSSSEPAAIVSYGGFMGAGGTLFRVPLSQLRYDSSNDRIALNVSDSELASLKNSDTSRGAAE